MKRDSNGNPTGRQTRNTKGKLEQRREIRQSAARASMDAWSWGAITALCISFTERGGAIRVGLTRDGGALAIGVYWEDDYATEYLRPGEDVSQFGLDLCETLDDALAERFNALLTACSDVQWG